MSSFTVATLNLNAWHDHWLRRRGLVVAEFLDTLPDLIALQEVYRPIEQARWLRSQINSRLTGRSSGPYQLVQKRKRGLIEGLFEGLAILTKLPVLSHDSLPIGSGGYIALRANVELPTRESLDFVSIQLAPEAYPEARLEQILAVQGWLYGRDFTPMQVIAGDFAEEPAGVTIKQMKQVYRSTFNEVRGSELIATYPTALASTANNASASRDYIFISKRLGPVLDAQIICRNSAAEDPALYPSNHIGLLAEIGVNY